MRAWKGKGMGMGTGGQGRVCGWGQNGHEMFRLGGQERCQEAVGKGFSQPLDEDEAEEVKDTRDR